MKIIDIYSMTNLQTLLYWSRNQNYNLNNKSNS